MNTFLGKTFHWFVGVVEDRQDPLQLGRVKVRVLGIHTKDKVQLPTADLPWAEVIGSTSSASVSGIGFTNLGLVEGSWVFGFYKDEDMQAAMILGSLYGNPTTLADSSIGFNDPNGIYPKYINASDVNAKARGTSTDKTNAYSTSGLTDPYAAVYPYNKVYESERGHTIEIDDTTDAERLSLMHKDGYFIEWSANGQRLDYSDKRTDYSTTYTGITGAYTQTTAAYSLTTASYNQTSSTININGSSITTSASGDINMTASGAFNVNASTFSITTPSGTMTFGDNATATFAGDYTLNIGGTYTRIANEANVTPRTDKDQQISSVVAALALA